VLLQHLLEEGLSKTAIAARVGVSRRLIYHWLATGQLARRDGTSRAAAARAAPDPARFPVTTLSV